MKELVKYKKGLEMNLIGWLILGLGVAAFVLIGYFYAKNSGFSLMEYIKSFLRLRG